MKYRLDMKYQTTLVWCDVAYAPTIEQLVESYEQEWESGLWQIVERKTGKVVWWKYRTKEESDRKKPKFRKYN